MIFPTHFLITFLNVLNSSSVLWEFIPTCCITGAKDGREQREKSSSLKIREQGMKRFRTGIQFFRTPVKGLFTTGQTYTIKQCQTMWCQASGSYTFNIAGKKQPKQLKKKKKKAKIPFDFNPAILCLVEVFFLCG